MAGTITPKNWLEFQHYKDRKPSWIKLHRELLDNFDFHCLPVASRALAPCLWLLASEYDGGQIPADWPLIAFRLRMSDTDVIAAVTPLIDKGFFIASEVLADRKRSACLETYKAETYKAEKKKTPRAPRLIGPEFESFWQAYPRKTAKAAAEKAWLKLSPDELLLTEIMAGLARAATSPSWLADGSQFIPHPATWLNGRRWTDEPIKINGDTHAASRPVRLTAVDRAIADNEQHRQQREGPGKTFNA